MSKKKELLLTLNNVITFDYPNYKDYECKPFLKDIANFYIGEIDIKTGSQPIIFETKLEDDLYHLTILDEKDLIEICDDIDNTFPYIRNKRSPLFYIPSKNKFYTSICGK